MANCFSDCVSLTFTTKPLNVAGIVGLPNSLELACAIAQEEKPIQYSWREDGTIIFDEGNKTELHSHPAKFTLESTASPQWENYDMLVQTDIWNVAGQYLCTATHSATIEAYADVLLLCK